MTRYAPAPRGVSADQERDQALDEMFETVRMKKTMQDALFQQVEEGVKLKSPLDEVRYEPGQKGVCKAACVRVAEELARVMND